MAKGYDLQCILDKLQRPRGYQGCRICPHESLKATWLAEMYTANQTRSRKSWKPLLVSQTNEIRTFTSPQEAERALIEERGQLFTDSRPLYIRLQLGVPKTQLWRDLISHTEQQAPGSLEVMIEDAAARLVAALRELRGCQSQRRANRLYEIIIGQSNRLSHLAQYTNQEAERLQWLKVGQRGLAHPPA